MKLPKHMSLTIQHNEHKNCYVTIQHYFTHYPHLEDADLSEKNRCIEQDSIWEIQWYPNTPIGFYHVFASTLEKALELANQSD